MAKSTYTLFTIFLLATLLCIFSTCRKKAEVAPSLPPATQTGKATIGFLLNDEVWLPSTPCEGLNKECAISTKVLPADTGSTELTMSFSFVRKKGDKTSSLSIQTKTRDNGPGSFISGPGEVFDSLSATYKPENVVEFQTYQLSRGSFIISKLDRTKQIISGTFSLVFYASPKDSVVISEGRFDLGFTMCRCH